MECVLEHIDM